MDERMLARIDRTAGVHDLAGRLERLAPTDLQSLLLEVYQRHVRRRGPQDVLAQYRRNRYGSSASQHFRLLALVAAGRGREFVVDALVEQIAFFTRLVAGATIRLTPLGTALADEVRERLDGRVELDPGRTSGRNYYVELCFKVFADGLEIGDGGLTTWTQALLGDRKERLLIAGLGSERAAELVARRATV